MTDLTTMTPAQIADLTPAELAAYPALDFEALTSDQVGAFTPAHMAALSTEQLDAIGPVVATLQDMISAFQDALMSASSEERATFLAPLTTLIASPEFTAVKNAIDGFGTTYDDESSIKPHLDCIKMGMRNLVGFS